MATSLIVSTLIPTISLPFLYIIFRSKKINLITAPLFGLGFWSLSALVQFIMLQLILLLEAGFDLARYSNVDSYIVVQTKYRTILFWFILISILFGEIIRYKGLLLYNNLTFQWNLLFGLGWGIGEYITRFSDFNHPSPNVNLILAIYIIFESIVLSILILRSSDTSKFVMYSMILKFVGSLGIFGSIGYQNPSEEIVTQITIIMLFYSSLIGLSFIAKWYASRK